MYINSINDFVIHRESMCFPHFPNFGSESLIDMYFKYCLGTLYFSMSLWFSAVEFLGVFSVILPSYKKKIPGN